MLTLFRKSHYLVILFYLFVVPCLWSEVERMEERVEFLQCNQIEETLHYTVSSFIGDVIKMKMRSGPILEGNSPVKIYLETCGVLGLIKSLKIRANFIFNYRHSSLKGDYAIESSNKKKAYILKADSLSSQFLRFVSYSRLGVIGSVHTTYRERTSLRYESVASFVYRNCQFYLYRLVVNGLPWKSNKSWMVYFIYTDQFKPPVAGFVQTPLGHLAFSIDEKESFLTDNNRELLQRVSPCLPHVIESCQDYEH